MGKLYSDMSDSERKVEFEKYMAREGFRKSTAVKEGDEDLLNKGVTLNKEKKCKWCTQGVTGTCKLNSVFCMNTKNRPYFEPSGVYLAVQRARAAGLIK